METTTGIPDGQVRYAHLSEQQYSQGIAKAIDAGLGVEYGERFQIPGRNPINNAWGRYITVLSGDPAALQELLESISD